MVSKHHFSGFYRLLKCTKCRPRNKDNYSAVFVLDGAAFSPVIGPKWQSRNFTCAGTFLSSGSDVFFNHVRCRAKAELVVCLLLTPIEAQGERAGRISVKSFKCELRHD